MRATTAKKKRTKLHRSNSVKVTALTMLKSGKAPTEVSKELGIPTSTMRDWRRAAMAAGTWSPDASGDSGLARPAPHVTSPGSGGQNRKITDRLKRRIKTYLDNDPFLTPVGLQRQIPALRTLHKSTIRKCIAKDLGIPSRMAATKPFLTPAQKTRRLDWAQRKRKWRQRKWRKVCWSDETHIELWKGFRHGQRVRRSSTISRYDPRMIRRSVKHPQKIMIWGSFGNGKLGRLYFVAKNQKMNAEMYKDVLKKHLRPSLRKTGCSVFMQDGAPCHTARSIKEWFAENDIEVLDWVGQSCDLNPIENLWRKLNTIIGTMPACSNLNQLIKQIKKAWKILGKDKPFLTALTDSMPRRIAAVIEANGDVTKY